MIILFYNKKNAQQIQRRIWGNGSIVLIIDWWNNRDEHEINSSKNVLNGEDFQILKILKLENCLDASIVEVDRKNDITSKIRLIKKKFRDIEVWYRQFNTSSLPKSIFLDQN